MVFLEKLGSKFFSLMEPENSLPWYKQTLGPILKQFDPSHSFTLSFCKIRFNIVPYALKPPKWSIFSRLLVFLSLNILLSVLYSNIHP
jgi:phosphoglycerol transferase MdoB-like AlkP superfamily enzyme